MLIQSCSDRAEKYIDIQTNNLYHGNYQVGFSEMTLHIIYQVINIPKWFLQVLKIEFPVHCDKHQLDLSIKWIVTFNTEKKVLFLL